jgi:pimeloyl-ACP methyl ester carboxylesterase
MNTIHTVIRGKKPNPTFPSVVFVGGLSASEEHQTEEWNGSGCVRRVGLQSMMSNYTETLSFDWPGTGRSPTPQKFPQNMDEEANLVYHLLSHHKIAPPYIFVAQSIGCYTTLMYAIKYPRHIHAITLIHPPPLSLYTKLSITKAYEKKHPSSAERIRSMHASISKWPSSFKSSRLVVHLDMVPFDAPKAVHERNDKALYELERYFPNRIYHMGATPRIHKLDPYPILASIVRFLQPKRKPQSIRKRKRIIAK